MRATGKKWVFGLGMAALMALSSLSIPVLTDRMIAAAEDDVQVDVAQAEPSRKTTVSDAEELVGYELSDEARAVLEAQGRAAFRDAFGIEIPEDYQALDRKAYEYGGDIGYTLSLMPEDWESIVDPLPSPSAQSCYTVQFGGVNVGTGEAAIIGIQRSVLGYFDVDTFEEAEYTNEQIEAWEGVAREFAAGLGMETQELIGTDKVAASYPPGCLLTFSRGNDKTLSVTVSEDGEVSGYSLQRGQG